MHGMAWLLTSKPVRWIGAAIGVIAAFVGVYFMGGHKAADRVKNEALEDANKRVQKGREAVRDNRGDDPSERVSGNDDKW